MLPKILFPLLGFATALFISAYAIPIIIKVAFIRKLYDKPGGRKTHKRFVPNLGGIAIFAGFVLSFICWTNFSGSVYLQYLILGLIILHFLGVKDDIVPLTPHKKLVGQIIAAAVLVVPGRFRINDLNGIIGVYHLTVPVSIGLSIFVVILLINSFNLIDGIDGLAGGISLLISLLFSYIFWKSGLSNILVASVALAGALVGFLFYNRQPARIFMGDAGSMCIGYLMAAFSFQFMNSTATNFNGLFHRNPGVLLAVFIVPLFDTLRVFTIRILNKKSPFQADSNHIHHKLLQMGLSHGMASITLTLVTLSFIITAYFLQDINPNLFVLVILSAAGLLSLVPTYVVNHKNIEKYQLTSFSDFKVIHPQELVDHLSNKDPKAPPSTKPALKPIDV
jgi:UDP-N-acetylmuramyl pentapeptide phosphotransferase/UDP-N-acetylglucosamine-1-phosphate transferase